MCTMINRLPVDLARELIGPVNPASENMHRWDARELIRGPLVMDIRRCLKPQNIAGIIETIYATLNSVSTGLYVASVGAVVSVCSFFQKRYVDLSPSLRCCFTLTCLSQHTITH